ncbi:hypothetical protein GN244_ATG18901 [Phytophthora infestans]|uniref:Secreted RxLR effector peptide protein n=1 Tax=Phytophthora infestans TaxID=4787 RepID=A0A833SH82_PHYIN|nr:hypothetical protein GN244_ATG18901 [Phytophthora infestans]
MGVRSFLFLTLLSFFAYFGNIRAERTDTGMASQTDSSLTKLGNALQIQPILMAEAPTKKMKRGRFLISAN